MSRKRRDWHAVCKIKARNRIDIPPILTQNQANESNVEAPYQEDATLFKVLFNVNLDYSSILVDNNAYLLEVPSNEIRQNLIFLTRNGFDREDREVQEDTEENDNKEKEVEFEDFDSTDDKVRRTELHTLEINDERSVFPSKYDEQSITLNKEAKHDGQLNEAQNSSNERRRGETKRSHVPSNYDTLFA
ncbi:hypothetical protein CDL12_20374 [Handroanthus impetiginosus]|uniref:Uncharacterized protein n=1 Tax=Handroanthus impetiginosus TaxID=429701 RepID=A0A2G9GPC2_9LAMI|nr:hypothetical protein CDL12_20374 [Handroanthus impetiginosus]